MKGLFLIGQWSLIYSNYVTLAFLGVLIRDRMTQLQKARTHASCGAVHEAVS